VQRRRRSRFVEREAEAVEREAVVKLGAVVERESKEAVGERELFVGE